MNIQGNRWNVNRDNSIVGKKICIDPGHGGKDPGAIGPTGTREADVVLSVGLEVARLLEEQQALVKLTRSTDIMVPAPDATATKTAPVDNEMSDELLAKEDLPNRVAIANRWPSDLFVSIHCNSAANAAANGTETYIRNAETPADRKLGAALQKRMLEECGLNDRHLRNANFYVIKNTNSPAALVELGFLSNAQEEKVLADPDMQKKFAKAIVAGINDFFTPQRSDATPPAFLVGC